MSVVEKVEELLDDCGVRYDVSDDDYSSYFYLHWCDECGDYLSRIVVKGECVTVERSYLTPEQAVSEAVDGVVGIVRCKDCVWASRRVDGVVQCGISRLAHMADHYCADGVREVDE